MDRRTPDRFGVIPEDESLDMEAIADRDGLRDAWAIMLANAHEATAFESSLNESPAGWLQFWASDLPPRELFREPSRRIQNFLASAKALVDHCRIHIKAAYKAHSFLDEYQRRIDADLKDHPLVQFVHKLRDYNLHYLLPLTQAKLSLDPTSAYPHRFLLSKQRLYRWDGWGLAARSFIDSQPDTFEIMPIITEYVRIINELHEWRETAETAVFNLAMTAQHGPNSRVARQFS